MDAHYSIMDAIKTRESAIKINTQTLNVLKVEIVVPFV